MCAISKLEFTDATVMTALGKIISDKSLTNQHDIIAADCEQRYRN